MQGDEHEVREFLSTLIKARLAAKPTKLLLIMGESAENWLLSPEQKNTVKNGSFQMTSDVTGLVTPSLIEMLNQPQSKQQTWQIISQYLKQHGV
jgi:uracil-DNA glycosylase